MRRPRPIVLLGLLASVAALAFPGEGSALLASAPVQLTPSGPVPATLTIVIGTAYPVWQNSDTVTHTVTFADGQCSFQVPPGGQVSGCPSYQVGEHSYTVDGTIQGSITFVPESRSVMLTARSHTIRRGAHLHIHGLLDYALGTDSLPPSGFTDMPVTVLARRDRHHPFRQIATAATGRFGTGSAGHDGWPWWLDIHPKRTTIYIAEANSQPDSGQWWRNAMSKPFKVVVRGTGR